MAPFSVTLLALLQLQYLDQGYHYNAPPSIHELRCTIKYTVTMRQTFYYSQSLIVYLIR